MCQVFDVWKLLVRIIQIVLRGRRKSLIVGKGMGNFAGWIFLLGSGNQARRDSDHSNLFQSWEDFSCGERVVVSTSLTSGGTPLIPHPQGRTCYYTWNLLYVFIESCTAFLLLITHTITHYKFFEIQLVPEIS